MLIALLKIIQLEDVIVLLEQIIQRLRVTPTLVGGLIVKEMRIV